MQLNGWDRGPKITADGKGLVGQDGAILLRKAADHLGLTAGLSAALLKKGTSPRLDLGRMLASLAVAIALGAPVRPHSRWRWPSGHVSRTRQAAPEPVILCGSATADRSSTKSAESAGRVWIVLLARLPRS
jgi:hypothetical protein